MTDLSFCTSRTRGSGLLGLLITFGVIMIIMWYSFRLMTAGQPAGADPLSDRASLIKAANDAKQLIERRSGGSSQN